MAETFLTKGRRKAGTQRLTIKRVAEALRESAGIQALAAAKLGTSRATLCRYIQKHEKLVTVIEETQDELTDIAEGKLIEKIRSGDMAALKYFLDNFGQRRGYGIRKLAFKDGDGQVMVPAYLVTDGRMSQDDWEAKYGPLGAHPTTQPPQSADDIPPEQLN